MAMIALPLPLHVLLHCISRLPPLSVLLPSPVNKEGQNTSLSFSCAILRCFLSFFPLFSTLLLLLVSFKSWKGQHFMTYKVTTVKGCPILPELNLRFSAQERIFIFLSAQKCRLNVSQITFWVLVFGSILRWFNSFFWTIPGP